MPTAQDGLANPSLVQPAPILSHEWRLVQAGIGWMRASIIVLLPVSCMSAPLALIVDRSDQAGFLIIFGGAHVVVAIPQMIGLLLCCGAPEGSRARRQARLTVWLAVAAVGFVVALVAAIFVMRNQRLVGDLFDLWQHAILIAAVSWCVNLALTGFNWLRMHVALGRDVSDPVSSGCAENVTEAWLVICAVAGLFLTLYVVDVSGLPHPFNALACGAVMLTPALELFYLRMLNRARQSLRTRLDEPPMLDDGPLPGDQILRNLDHGATITDTRIQP